MDVNRLTEILLQRRDLDKRALRLLERELKKYPWSQPLRIMYAKALNKLDKSGFEEAVNKAAAAAPDPVAFRDILSDRASRKGEPAGGLHQPEDQQQKSPLPGEGKQEDHKLPDSPHPEADSKDPDIKSGHAVKSSRDRASQLEIINRFIENEPRISAPRDDIPEGDYAPQSLEESDDMISETLADVLARQGKTARAIDIFEKLSLKFPEKSSYFAKKIELISKENNKTE